MSRYSQLTHLPVGSMWGVGKYRVNKGKKLI